MGENRAAGGRFFAQKTQNDKKPASLEVAVAAKKIV